MQIDLQFICSLSINTHVSLFAVHSELHYCLLFLCYSIRDSQMKTEHLLQSENGISFIQKKLVEVLIHLSHCEMRRSIPVL